MACCKILFASGPAGSVRTYSSAPGESCSTHWLTMLPSISLRELPGGRVCAKTSASLGLDCDHCITTARVALRLSGPLANWLAHAMAACGSCPAQIEAMAWQACPRCCADGNCAALAAASTGFLPAHALNTENIPPHGRMLPPILLLWRRSRAACGSLPAMVATTWFSNWLRN